MLARQLGHGVRGDRIGQHSFMLGQRGRVAISGRGSRVDHPPHPRLPRRHQQIQRRIHAGYVGRHRIGHRTRHRRQRRLMKNDLHALARPCADRRIGQVAFEKLHRLQPDQILALAGAEVVDAAHGLAARQKRRRNRPANKARRSVTRYFAKS